MRKIGQKKIGAIIALDGEKEFKKSVSDVNSELKSLKSESNLVKEQFADQANTMEALKEKHKVLEKVLDAHKKKEEEIKKGLDHAKESYEKVGSGLKTLKDQYEEAQKKLERMEKTSGTATDEIDKQRDEMKKLADQIEKGERNYETAEKRISVWETSLNNAKTQTIKANRELEQNEKYLQEAQNSTDKCAVSIDEFGKKTKEAAEVTTDWGTAMKVATAGEIVDGMANLAKKLGEESVGAANEFENSANQVQASTGLSADAMREYEKVMDEVYRNNYGDNFEDVGEAISIIAQNMGELDPSQMQKIAESSITLRDTFDFDYQEQIRAVKMLMDTWGTSAEDAYNLIAQGAQNGLNKNGDLLDTINEYAVHYKQMGATAEEFFNSLANGTASGTFSVDKLGDAYKEFGIRVKDTATSTDEGYQLLNMDADEMRSKFAAGGDSARQATEEVLSALFGMDDQVKQNQAGVDLFGTMWEDLGIAGVKALTNLNGEISTTKDTMSEIQDIKYDSMTNSLTQVTRSLQMEIVEKLSERYLPKINEGLKFIGENLDTVLPAAKGLGTALAVYKIVTADKFANIASGVGKLATSMTAAATATEGATVAQEGLNAAQKANMIGLVVSLLAGAGVALKSYVDNVMDSVDVTKDLRNEMEQTGDSIKQSISSHNDSVASIEAEWDGNKKLVDELYKLNDVQDKTAGQKERMRAIVAQLSDDIPELASAFDAETSSMKVNQSEIDKSIEKRKKYALAVAAQDSMQEMAKNVAAAEAQIRAAEDKLDDLIKAKGKYKELLQDKAGDTLGSFLNWDLSVNGMHPVEKQIEELEAELEELRNTKEQAEGEFEAAGQMVEDYGGSLDEAAESVASLSSAENEAASNTQQFTEDQAQAYEEMQKSIESSIESTVSLFDKFDGGDEISADKMLENLKSQVDGVNKWSENMKTLAAATGQGMTKAFYDQLIQIGPSGANAVQELVDALQNKTEKFTEICQKYTEAFDLSAASETIASLEYEMQDGIGEVEQAANDGAQQINNSLKEIGNTDIYEALRRAFTVAAQEAGQGGNVISAKTSEAFENAVKAAQGKGTEISQTFVDEIANGKISIQDAITQLNNSISTEQQKTAESSEQNAKDSMNSYGEGVRSEKQNIVSATQDVFGAAKEQGKKAVSDFYSVGSYMGAGVANGLRSGTVEVKKAAIEVSDAAVKAFEKRLDIHSPSRVMDKKIGVNITRGISNGILRERILAVRSVSDICSEILKAAETELDIHSPSRKFRDRVGANISKGIAFGIKDTSKKAIEELRKLSRDLQASADTLFSMSQKSNGAGSIRLVKMAQQHLISANAASQKMEKLQAKGSDTYSKQVYKSASSWYKAYKKAHVVSLDDEKYFWKQVAGAVKKGTTGYTQALEKSTKIDNFQKKMKEKIKSSFNVSEYTTNSKGEQEKKSAETYYSEIYSKASKYFENYEVLHNLSLQQEEYYWQQVQKKMKKGTQAYYDATKKLKSVQSQIKTEVAEEKARQKQEAAEEKQSNRSYALSGGALSSYKTYFQVSAKAEYQYWDIVRKKFKAGTAERIEADQKYLEAKESYNEQLEQLNQDYYDNCKETQDKLKDDIKDLTDAYKSSVSERKDSIYSSFNLFDQFESTSKSGRTLLYNLKTQVAGYADWEKQLSALSKKGVLSDGLLKELQEMGPQASASIHALNQLSTAELKEYNELWKQKNALAESQAVKENEALRQETQKKIDDLKTAAQKELTAYKKEYDKSVKELSKSIEKPLKTLAQKATTIGEDTASSLIAGIKKGATKKETTAELNKVSTTVSKKLGKLKSEGKTIGDNTLQGIIDGLTNKKKIDASAQELISALRKSLQKAADIHSPSRLFRKDIGANLGEGVNLGVRDKIKAVSRTGEEMIKEMLEAQKRQAERQQSQLQAQLAGINSTVGVAELNNLISIAPVQNVKATVDNADMLSMMQRMMTVMQAGFENMANMQMVTDTGALVGETSAQMSTAFAMSARRLR